MVVVFLIGFLPPFLQKRRVQNDLEDVRARLALAQQQNAIDEIRTLAGRILLEASRQNYGTAREHSTVLFNKVRDLAEKSGNASLKASLLELLNSRDSVTSGLSQGNALVIPELQSLLGDTYDLPNAETFAR
jgi:hypothetical protein